MLRCLLVFFSLAVPAPQSFVYDNAAAANGLYYTFAEINAAFPNDFQLMGGIITGAQYGAARKQYITIVPVTFGGQFADGTNSTTIKDTNCDIYCGGTGQLLWRTGIPQALKTEFGTKVSISIGGAQYISGRDGVNIYSISTMQMRGQILRYGCSNFVYSTLALNYFDTGASGISEMAGCTDRSGGTYIIGNNSTPQMDVYNCTFATTTVGAFANTLSLRNTDNIIFAGSAISVFFQSNVASMAVNNAQLLGSPTTSDFRWISGSGTDWILFQPQFSGSTTKPRFSTSTVNGGPPLSSPTKEYWYFNTKVVDELGNPVANVPVMLSSDIDGLAVDTKTFGDGDIGYTDGISGIMNAVRVRDHYNPTGTTSYAVRDRVFTLTLNGFGGIWPPLPGYNTKIMKFEWPGRDVFQGAFQLNGGEFKPCIMPVTLMAGAPSVNTQWVELEHA